MNCNERWWAGVKGGAREAKRGPTAPDRLVGGGSQYDVSETGQALHCRINYMIRWMPGLHTDIHKIGKIKACIGFRWYLLLDGFTSSPSTVILYWIIGLYLAVCPSKLECPFKRKWAGALPKLSETGESRGRGMLMASCLNYKELKRETTEQAVLFAYQY